MCSRFSRPGPPFGIFEKSSLPSVFWPSQRNAQWSVEIAESASERTAFQSTSQLDLSRDGRRVDVLRALEVRLRDVVERVEEVLRAGLAPDVPARLARAGDRLHRLAAGDVDDVERRAGEVRELDRAVRRLALRLGRARERVVERLGVPGLERLADEDVDHVAVLGVHHHERAGLGRDLHRPEERLVVDHERALVGHEELVGGDALVGQRRELLERAALLQVGDRHVVAHVDHLLAVGLRLPLVERLRRTSRPAAG